MMYKTTSESSSSMRFTACVKMENPFSRMFKKLIDLIAESTVESSELVREISALQHHLKESVQQRTGSSEKERCQVMHEIKNALTGILTCAHALNGEKLEQGDRQEFLQLIGCEIGRIVGMTEELIDCDEKQRDRLSLQYFSVEMFLATLMPLVRDYTLSKQNIELHVDAQYPGPIQVDVEKLQKIFMNVIYNARDAMPNGGSLTIRSGLVDTETLLFEFIDTGCGMSPEMQEQIFEPFATEGKALGTGVGMTIVKEMVELHQGRVEVESVLGEGTEVRIWLPIYQ